MNAWINTLRGWRGGAEAPRKLKLAQPWFGSNPQFVNNPREGDPDLDVPAGTDWSAWLSDWHNEREWMHAVHRTKNSNGIIGLTEQFLAGRVEAAATGAGRPAAGGERSLELQRAESEFRGYHGSFLRISTHSVLAFWEGAFRAGRRSPSLITR